MGSNEDLSEANGPEFERSSDDIRQDIAREGENISQTVEQIGDRIKEKLDWRGYVKGSPYLALGAAVGLGYLVSGMFRPRVSPQDRIMKSLADGVRDSVRELHHGGASAPGLVKLTVLSIVAKAASDWVLKETAKAGANRRAETQPRAEGAQPQAHE